MSRWTFILFVSLAACGKSTTSSSSSGGATSAATATGSTGGSATGSSGGSSGTASASSTTTSTGTSGTTGSTTGCSGAQLDCHGACVNPSVDPDHCGGCDVVCDSGQVCAGGACAGDCEPPLVPCGRACVDRNSDSAHCGDCDTACDADAGLGCANGACVATIPVGPGPGACPAGGAPIFFDHDAGALGCTGNLAQVTFRWALCSCESIGTSAAITTDGFDSRQGPWAAGGGGGGLGVNANLGSSAAIDVGGTLWVAGANGVTDSNDVTVLQELHSGGQVSVDGLQVGGDAYVAGDLHAQSASAIDGTLYVPASSTVSGSVDVASTVHQPVVVPDPCDCAHPLDVAGIAHAHATANDDALIGLDPDALRPAPADVRLDLPCGSYYLSGVSGSHAVTVVAHGNAALYVDGDVTSSQAIAFLPDPSAQLDVFIAGKIGTSAHLTLGNANYPSQLRIYLGATGQALGLSSPADIAGNLYAMAGSIGTSGAWLQYGSLITKSYGTSASTTIHYDRAVVSAGSICGAADAGFVIAPPDAGAAFDGGATACSTCQECGNQACVDGHCGSCTSSDQCCAPLSCINGSCVPPLQ